VLAGDENVLNSKFFVFHCVWIQR